MQFSNCNQRIKQIVTPTTQYFPELSGFPGQIMDTKRGLTQLSQPSYNLNN